MSKNKKPDPHPSNTGGFIAVVKKEAHEVDYLDQLSPEDRAWYERFFENEYNARYHKDGKDVYEPGSENAKRTNREKQRKLKDVYSKVQYQPNANGDNSTDEMNDSGRDSQDSTPHSTMLMPRFDNTKGPRKPQPKKAPLRPPMPPGTKIETLEEFLKRKGKITKVDINKSGKK